MCAKMDLAKSHCNVFYLWLVNFLRILEACNIRQDFIESTKTCICRIILYDPALVAVAPYFLSISIVMNSGLLLLLFIKGGYFKFFTLSFYSTRTE